MLQEIVFEWDQWNEQKNERKHGVSSSEAESAFYDPSGRYFKDREHSTELEPRYILYGRSMEGKILMVGFTLRDSRVRVITARTASKKERKVYEEK